MPQPSARQPVARADPAASVREGHLPGRTEVALPIGAVTGAGDSNRLNTAEHQENDLDRPRPRKLAQASNATHLPRCVVAL